MASLTRNRNDVGGVPNDLMAKMYGERAVSAGLILTECTGIEPTGSEWSFSPGLYTRKQVAGWRKVVDAVHAEGSAIFAQLWHPGRVAHPKLQGGQPNVAPSAIGAAGGKFRELAGAPGYVMPEAIEDPWSYVELFERAANNAMEAGFDGVELNAANGYLADQFIEAHSNQRTDEWGGSPEKRSKFVLEVIRAFVRATGDPKKVGIKLSPGGGYNDMGDPAEIAIEEYKYLIEKLNALGIGYIQLKRYNPLYDPTEKGNKLDVVQIFRPLIKNVYCFVNGGLSGEEAEHLLDPDSPKSFPAVHLAVFGTSFIANPNLMDLIQTGKEYSIKPPISHLLYTGGPDGYINFDL